MAMDFDSLIYTKADGTPIEIIRNEEDGSFWITANSLAVLCRKDRSSIQRKIRKETGLLGTESESVCAKVAHTDSKLEPSTPAGTCAVAKCMLGIVNVRSIFFGFKFISSISTVLKALVNAL